jgi:hypothetical protein
MPLNEDAANFMKYAFNETKDLAEHFLTVITAVLVFSLTFSERIADFKSATAKTRGALVTAWCSFLLAIILCGIAIGFVALSAGFATSNGKEEEYWGIMYVGIRCLMAGGALFVVGLIALMISALLSGWKRQPNAAQLHLPLQ